MAAHIRIGISGWRYPPWRGTFYPKGLAQKKELPYAASKVSIIEINGSFYSLQRPSSYAGWYASTPDDFVFSVKGPQYITHFTRLKNAGKPLANFFASGVLCLKEKLGPFLWQLPPNFQFDAERLDSFFELLPHDMKAAARLAKDAEPMMRGRSATEVDKNRPLRHAIEIRHTSFETPEFVRILRRHGVALVIAESARNWPMMRDITADFIYMRLHGDKELYKSGYSDASLDRWAKQMRAWARKTKDIYCFFDNTDVKLRAPFDAQTLMKKLGVEWP